MNNSDDKNIQERDTFPALLNIYQEAFSILGEFCQEDDLCERLYALRGKVFDLMVELGYEERLNKAMALQDIKNRKEQAETKWHYSLMDCMSKDCNMFAIFVKDDTDVLDVCLGEVIEINSGKAMLHPWDFRSKKLDKEKIVQVVISEQIDIETFNDLSLMDKYFAKVYWHPMLDKNVPAGLII